MEHTDGGLTPRKALRALVFLAGLLFALACADEVLRSKTDDAYLLHDRRLAAQQMDVFFAGSSHMNNAAYPMQLWEEYGIASYNQAQTGQILPVSYYACEEIVDRWAPKVLVLDVYMLYHNAKTGNMSLMHQSLDTMAARNRFPAILDLIPFGDQKEFLFPLTLYHTRWKELTKADFTKPSSLLRGAAQNFNRAADLADIPYTPTDPSVKAEPGAVPVEYLDRVVRLCEQSGTTLVLVALPYLTSPEVEGATHDMSKDEAYFNWMGDYAAANGVAYINYFHLREELGFAWDQHMFNYSHMNYWGGQIITAHLGAYLAGHYDLPDRRQDPAYQNWNQDLAAYRQYLEDSLAAARAGGAGDA